tara:strand:- start:684 stop:932 length:249 start_codon:yes stop_codon:yes gene_type:complete
MEIATPHRTKNDNVYSESSNNFYYDDSGDGGYATGIRPLAGNHLEIRRVKRLYTQGANKKGDLAIPMQRTRDWLVEDVIGIN